MSRSAPSRDKEKAYDHAVMSDIRRAEVAAEAHYADNLTSPTSATDADFTPSSRLDQPKKKGLGTLLSRTANCDARHKTRRVQLCNLLASSKHLGVSGRRTSNP